MAVKLRLRREGAKKEPHFRVVAADSRAPRDGRFIEIIGDYHPTAEPSLVEIDEERALHWLRHGAQPTSAVVNLLRLAGVWEKFKPGDKPKRVRQPKEAGAAKKATQSQQTGGGDAPAEQTAAAPEEVASAPGSPEDVTAEPVAETQAAAETEGGPGEGTTVEATAPEQTPTEETSEEGEEEQA